VQGSSFSSSSSLIYDSRGLRTIVISSARLKTEGTIALCSILLRWNAPREEEEEEEEDGEGEEEKEQEQEVRKRPERRRRRRRRLQNSNDIAVEEEKKVEVRKKEETSDLKDLIP
jgi:hypothetical protein